MMSMGCCERWPLRFLTPPPTSHPEPRLAPSAMVPESGCEQHWGGEQEKELVENAIGRSEYGVSGP